jgi:hypothetical protein
MTRPHDPHHRRKAIEGGSCVVSSFTSLDHQWLVRFLEHRIADKRVLRLIGKWLAAGVIEEGSWMKYDEGVPQGASVSPLLANVYLHYVLDLWVNQWRRRHARGDVVIVRFVDDFVVGFEHRDDAPGLRLTPRSVDRVVRGVADRAGLELSAHVLRHTCVTNLVRAGNDLVLVAELAGHRRLETTRRYSLPSAADRQAAMEALELEE